VIYQRACRVMLFALCLSPLSLFAAKALDPVTISDGNVTASAIQWNASGGYDRVVLTVSGPDGVAVTKEFAAGQSPLLRLSDLGSKAPADGSYTWELRAVPRISAETRQKLAAARRDDDEGTVRRIQAETGLNREVVKSGSFAVTNGAFLTPTTEAPASAGSSPKATTNAVHPAPTTMDIVQADDVIIQGSLCVGLDCVVNESFGFDTIRLKENNTRIHFQDTSTGTGFPNVNWQLTANDSASGGLNKFSIDDLTNSKTPVTVIANAPTNSLYVQSTGKVGFGTNAPGLNLHITATDTPAIRQEQTSGGGFTAQTWDIGANEANWFVRDLTGGSRLPLRIRPGAPTSSVDIAASGNVGIGTASPGAHLDLGVGSAPRGANTDLLIASGGNVPQLELYATSKSAVLSYDGTTLNVFTNGTPFFQAMTIDNSGNIGIGGVTAPTNPIQHSSGAILTATGTWQNASSRALKEDISDLSADEALTAVRQLQPVKFVYKADPTDHQVGFIAEDVPALVATKSHKTLNSLEIVAVLTGVVKEQQKTIEDLQKRLDKLENKQ